MAVKMEYPMVVRMAGCTLGISDGDADGIKLDASDSCTLGTSDAW